MQAYDSTSLTPYGAIRFVSVTCDACGYNEIVEESALPYLDLDGWLRSTVDGFLLDECPNWAAGWL